MNQNNVKLRRYEDDLNVGGFGIIMLGAWTVLKLFMQILAHAKEAFNLEEFKDYDKTVLFIAYAIVVVLLALLALLVFWLHLYIGLNAMRAAKGQAYKKGYFVWSVILLVLVALGLFSYKESIKDLSKIDTTIASLIVDLTTIYVLGTIVTATRKIKGLKSKEQERE